jgi:prepilin-type N-terminal cleavage/methylation domain-containing protein
MDRMSRTSPASRGRAGVTLLELCTVIIIIGILAVLLYPVMGWYGERARRLSCTQNLKGLYTATSAYLNANNGVWPQIRLDAQHSQEYARSWFDTLHPYGLAWVNFICPSVQKKSGNPDYNNPRFNRTDYAAMVFDDKPWTARKWPHQPWFNERQSMHGNGQLLILTDGTLIDLAEARRLGAQPQNP